MTTSTAEEFKQIGNKAFSAQNYSEAIIAFSQAIELDASNHVLFSNRSAAYCSLKDYERALDDASKTIELNPTWVKGYSRKGAALHGACKYDEAVKCYNEGLSIEPSNMLLKKGLEEVDAAKAVPKEAESPFGKMFGADMWTKMATNPKLSPFLAQPDVVAKLQQIQANPNLINTFMTDQRIMTIMMGLMGLDGSMGGGAGDEQDTEMTDVKNSTAKYEEEEVEEEEGKVVEMNPDSTLKSKVEKKNEPEVIVETKKEEDSPRQASNSKKEEGNIKYKDRKFADAIVLYDAAFELDKTNVSVLTNKSAVLYEQELFQECIKVCEEAIEIGQALYADFKLLARAFGRMGNAYAKLNDYSNAIKFLQKSLAEHRTSEVLTRLRELEMLKKQLDIDAYRSPELSDQARERGNTFFKASKFVEGVTEYTEAIKRNDTDPRNYSNRAACYAKLLAMNEAEKDCNTAIKLDPKFVKAYIRKAAILHTKREYMACVDLCNEAKAIDVEGKHATELEAQIMKAYGGLNAVQNNGNKEATQKAAMENPEVQEILGDPIMQQILQQMQTDPGAAREHMSNPMIAKKIKVLINAGIVKTG